MFLRQHNASFDESQIEKMINVSTMGFAVCDKLGLI